MSDDCHVFLNRTFMARAHRVALIATVVTVTYLLLFFSIFPVPLDAKVAEQILSVVTKTLPILKHIAFLCVSLPSLQIPWWLLVSFGSYCLWSIGIGLVSLRECPEAYNELLVVSFLPFVHQIRHVLFFLKLQSYLYLQSLTFLSL